MYGPPGREFIAEQFELRGLGQITGARRVDQDAGSEVGAFFPKPLELRPRDRELVACTVGDPEVDVPFSTHALGEILGLSDHPRVTFA